jgi:histidyl-tRNA synthetase
LSFPFRRYQIQRVYRGERAQRGRFREFYQCDIDVIGKDQLSVRYDAEMPAVIYSVFKELNFGPFTIQINNRKLMRGLLGKLGCSDPAIQASVLREIDKIEKVGSDKVHDVLMSGPFGLRDVAIGKLLDIVAIRSRSHSEAMLQLSEIANFEMPLGQPDIDSKKLVEDGVSELRETLNFIKAMGVPDTHYAINLSIARGLDYYTGTVYETTLNDHPQIGSICSGGRYDNLAANYTKSHLPGVGISIGATRLFYQLREANLLPAAQSTVKVLVTQMDEAQLPEYLKVASLLRSAGIATEVVLEAGKLGKQFKYADRAGIRFVVVIGPDEIAKGTVTVKDMRKQDQFEVARNDLVKTLRVELEQAEAMPQ